MSDIGWKFPRTDGGMEGGINDAGIVTFDGHPLEGLAREIIQNSVDARLDEKEPVKITFELRTVGTSAFCGDELAAHINACIKEWSHDPKATEALRRAKRALSSDRITFLRITDSNTTGLRGDAWKTLVKMVGASFKQGEGAGGSFGVGKAAPFAVSPLRTVCYWSAFEDGDQRRELFQGKAVLVSHEHDFGDGPEPVQNVGFFGKTNQCEALEESEIPEQFRPPALSHQSSTSVWIAGFNPKQHDRPWQDAIAQSIVESFFYAIEKGDLDVRMEGDQLTAKPDVEISRLTVGDNLTRFESDADPESKIDEQIERSRLYWEMIHNHEPHAVMERSRHGISGAKLWLATEESHPDRELPNRVALIRGTGMLITDQPDWGAFRRLRDYAAVCVIDDEKSNELLRRMENPAHDQFQPERLGQSERRKGELALQELRAWIREELKKVAEQQVNISEDVDELLDYLYAEDPLDGKGGDSNAKKFDDIAEIRKRQPKRRALPTVMVAVSDDELFSGDGDDDGEIGGSGQGGGSGGGSGFGPEDGDGEGGTGSRGGSKGKKPFTLRDVRFVHSNTDNRKSAIHFTADETGTVHFAIAEAGDYSAIPRNDISLFKTSGAQYKVEEGFEVQRGVRYQLNLIGKQPTNEAAWQLTAYRRDDT